MVNTDVAVLALVKRGDLVRARARATAKGARIWVEVRFPAVRDNWVEARDRILAVLDVA